LVFSISVTPVSVSAEADTLACPAGTEPFTEYRLFFGRSRGNVQVVSDAAWRTFLANEITPRFPDGLTVLDARGQWRDGIGRMVRERTKLVIILAKPGTGGIKLTDEITEAYKRAFWQKSVLRAITAACVSF
jgi:hypothetical protein